MEISINGKRVPVTSLAEAVKKWCLYRDSTGIGASGMKRHDGKVFAGQKKIARISYNGRVWGNDHKEILV